MNTIRNSAKPSFRTRRSTRLLIQRLVLLAGDITIVFFTYLAAFWLRSVFAFFIFDDVMPPHRIHDVVHYVWLLVPGQVIIFYFAGLYEPLEAFQVRTQLRPIFGAITLEAILLAAFYFFVGDVPFPRSVLPVFWVSNCALTCAFRTFSFRLLVKSRPMKKAVVVGTSTVARTLLESLREKNDMRMNVVGVVLAPGEPQCEEVCGFQVLGAVSDVPDLIAEHNLDEILVASPNSWQQDLIPGLLSGNRIAHVSIIPSDYEILIGRLQDFRISDVPLIEIESGLRPLFQLAIKRMTDFAISFLLFGGLLPLFALIGMLIKLTSRGPILYRQLRIGKNGRQFKIIKFRTMTQDAERMTGPVLSNTTDDRVTSIGRLLRKTRLDELPQLMNIMKGDMSFVGPRPERPVFVQEYCKRISGYEQRFSVFPGLTGLAQINGTYASIPEIKIKYDLAYIQNFSLWLDLFVMLETLKVIVTGKGAN
ncbi:sugar transferase [bacterium]|nr:sugar transferase [bacterium]